MKAFIKKIMGIEAPQQPEHQAELSGQMSTSISDNQLYPQACLDAANDYRQFNVFRRNPIYNQILEHVSEAQGQQYLDIFSSDPELLARIDEFKKNDRWGGARTCDYPGVGGVSPTTLRYIKVLYDLKMHFGSIDGDRVCEIGVGYGGQCRVIDAYFKASSYCLVDIQPALALSQRYLSNYVMRSRLSFETMNELDVADYDLVISNYAFTELPREVQDVYLKKVVLNAKRGYITYNEISPEDFCSYKLDELKEMIPGLVVLKEEPLTGPKNCILVWGGGAE